MPHRRAHVLADVEKGGAAEVERAIAAARAAHPDWSRTPWHERAAIFLRAAELLSGPWRSTINAATMLNQSKTAYQAEIDAACETIDFLRYNAEYLVRIYEEQPVSSPGVWNRMEYRPLEGFVLAISPFNFTAIGANLTTSPALMGNTVVWKPASTQALSAWITMRILEEAGLPPGRDQPRLRPRRGDGRRRAREPRARRRPLHRLDGRLPLDLAHDRQRHRPLPQLPAHRRRDRRQGLHRRPPVRRPRRGRGGDRPRLVRVPGPEVLRRRRGSTSRRTSGATCARRSSARSAASAMGDVSDFTNFMGAVIDAAVVRHASATRSPRRGRRAPRSSPAAAPTTARAGSSSRP